MSRARRRYAIALAASLGASGATSVAGAPDPDAACGSAREVLSAVRGVNDEGEGSRAEGARLIEEAVRAMGGATRPLATIRDSVSAASITLTGGQGIQRGEMSREILYPDRIRVVVALAVGDMIQGFDGQQAWLHVGGQSVILPPSMGDEMKRVIGLADGIGVLREAQDRVAEVRRLPSCALEGRRADLVLWTRGAEQVVLFLDVDTHLLARASYRSRSPQGGADVDTLFSLHREIEGLWLPTRIITRRNGVEYSETLLKATRFNTGVDAARFAPF